MDTKQQAAQRDEQQDASLESAIRTHVKAALMDTHTCLPGIIRSFDHETQTATVQPAIQQIFVERGAVTLPLCVDVPVQFPSGGNFVLTFPVAPGDECLLVFSERAIDFWWDRGGVQLPAEYRLHDLSDAFAIMGVRSKPEAARIASVSTSAAELRTKNGTTVLRIDGDSVYVGGAAGAEPAVMGTRLISFLDALAVVINSKLPAGAPAVLASTTLTGPASLLAAKAKVL